MTATDFLNYTIAMWGLGVLVALVFTLLLNWVRY